MLLNSATPSRAARNHFIPEYRVIIGKKDWNLMLLD